MTDRPGSWKNKYKLKEDTPNYRTAKTKPDILGVINKICPLNLEYYLSENKVVHFENSPS